MAVNQHPNIISSFSTYKRLLLNHTSHCDPFYLYKVEHSTPLGSLRRLRFMPPSEPLSRRPIAFAPLSLRLFDFHADGISGRELALFDATNLILPMGDRAASAGGFPQHGIGVAHLPNAFSNAFVVSANSILCCSRCLCLHDSASPSLTNDHRPPIPYRRHLRQKHHGDSIHQCSIS